MRYATGRRHQVPRKAEGYAVLAVDPAKLRKRMKDKDISVRGMADLCDHRSHSHIYRLTTGATKTTSPRTADLMEAVLDARGLLFGRVSVRTMDQAAA